MPQLHRVSSNNTTITHDGKYTVVTLHGTQIVAFNASAVYLNTGRWKTSTTKNRMTQVFNQYGFNIHVFQQDYTWYVSTKAGTFRYFDYMGIDLQTGEILTDKEPRAKVVRYEMTDSGRVKQGSGQVIE